MSYDISIVDKDKNLLHAKNIHQLKGGNYILGGTTALHLNITYNYSPYFYKYIDKKEGIRWLYGKKVSETIPKLEEAASQLLDISYEKDYWAPTEGNVKQAILDLIELAKMAPSEESYWDGD